MNILSIKTKNQNTQSNTISENNLFYCYIHYCVVYNYDGNYDERSTIFPVLDKVYYNIEEAQVWLKTRKKSISGYDARPYDLTIEECILNEVYML